MARRHRDRHDRGLRGPLALPNRMGPMAKIRRTESREAFFTAAVTESLARISKHCPAALDGVNIGVEEVPHLAFDWTGNHVPLAAAVERTPESPAQVVVYRRPLEHRAASRRGLKILIHRTIVEQLAAVTNLEVETIDPTGYRDLDDDW